MEQRHEQFVESIAAMTRETAPQRRTPALPFIIAAALAGAVVSWFIPVALYELIVGSIGLSEIFGAFAAPLGLTARLLIAVAAAIVSAIAVAFLFIKTPPPRRRPQPHARRAPEGVETMASQAPEAGPFDRAEPAQSSGGWFQKILASLPAPRRFADSDSATASSGSGEGSAESKRLRPGAMIARDDARPRPIAAHAELGEPLPPLDLVPETAPLRAQAAPARQAEAPQGSESIEALTGRLARALGREDGGEPQFDPAPTPEPEPPRIDPRREELEAQRQAARLAVDEAEEAKARAERNVEEARDIARRAVENAEAAVLRADERAKDARHRLAALEEDIAALPVPEPVPAPQPAPQPAIEADAEPEQSADMDPALRDALRTLRRMTAQQ